MRLPTRLSQLPMPLQLFFLTWVFGLGMILASTLFLVVGAVFTLVLTLLTL